jgi:hypothetical protein
MIGADQFNSHKFSLLKIRRPSGSADAGRSADIRLLVDHVHSSARTLSNAYPATLAVVPVDDIILTIPENDAVRTKDQAGITVGAATAGETAVCLAGPGQAEVDLLEIIAQNSSRLMAVPVRRDDRKMRKTDVRRSDC